MPGLQLRNRMPFGIDPERRVRDTKRPGRTIGATIKVAGAPNSREEHRSAGEGARQRRLSGQPRTSTTTVDTEPPPTRGNNAATVGQTCTERGASVIDNVAVNILQRRQVEQILSRQLPPRTNASSTASIPHKSLDRPCSSQCCCRRPSSEGPRLLPSEYRWRRDTSVTAS